MKRIYTALLVVGVLSFTGIVEVGGAPAVGRVALSTPVAACGLTEAAFCDTFSQPVFNPAGDREGELNARSWGVSRQLGFNNVGQGQYAAAVRSLEMIGSCPAHRVTIETDIVVCHGRLNDVVNDNPDITPANEDQPNDDGTVTSLAMYPKQPFDFAKRTGKVVFDVSDDSGGMHTAWPEFWVTDIPVPDPFAHFSSWQALPQYGFGIRLGAVCIPYDPSVSGSGDSGCGPDCHNNSHTVVTVSSVITVKNYRENDSDAGDSSPFNPATLRVMPYGCVTEPTKPGQLNHFQIDVSEDQIAVYGTNAGRTSPLVHLATIPNADLGFTRGYIWLEDDHYDANKQVDPRLQAIHTFTWGNVGFDGPVLPRDLGFDAPDSGIRVRSYPRLENLGWLSSASAPATITIPRVSGIHMATGALLTFSFIDPDTAPVNLEYSLNGKATHTVEWPFIGTVTNSVRTIGIPTLLSEVRRGTNHVRIWSDQGTLILSNIDLIMKRGGRSGEASTAASDAFVRTSRANQML
jgi:hypothetical protein